MNTILGQLAVHIDGSAAGAARLDIARELALQYGAELTAVYAAEADYVELAPMPQYDGTLGAGVRAIEDQRLGRARAIYGAQAGRSGVRAFWRQAAAPPVEGFARHALYADLLVLGQEEPGAADGVPAGFAEDAMAESGRPALVIPYIGAPGAFGDVIAIAWKETREAARAVAAALPLLRHARRVDVLAWGEPAADAEGAPMGLERYLCSHRVNTVWHHHGAEPEQLGELLLSRVFDLGSDLLVMGCYGHGRARERLMGGVSRTLLRSATLPLLMAR